jgi:hypothetical protein
MKKWIMIAGLLLLTLPVAVQAEGFTYTTNPDNTITITGYDGPGGEEAITNTIENLSVTRIENSAFYDNATLTSIIIPNSVTNIGDAAFFGCTSLSAITVDALNSVYSSMDGILFNKIQTTLIVCPEGKAGTYTVSNSVTSIGDYAFASCTSLALITIPNSVTRIGEAAFDWCTSLTNAMLGNSVTSIGDYAFASCTSLTSIIIPNSVTNIGIQAFYNCTSLTNAMIGNSVTRIGNFAFASCTSLTCVTIPNSVTNIGIYAFAYCTSLTRVTIPSSITCIEDGMFSFCTSLTEVYFKGNAPLLGEAVFYDTVNATVYYLPGSTGWDTWSVPPPVVLWNPQVQNPGVQSNRFGFNITGTNDFTVVVEARTNLTSGIWVPVKTNMLTGGLVQFSDPASTNYSKRYYRVSMPQ